MCGIAGVLMKNGDPPPSELLDGFVAALAHRGPDASGKKIIGAVGVAHTRLKILDLSDRANQPWTEDDDVLVFNGEIFNYVELRKELAERHNFVSRSDTEVLFHALRDWGSQAVRRLEGQFAFAFLDSRRGYLLLARDHAGICPLYTHETDAAIYFASEIKALLSLAPCRADAAGLFDYLTFRYTLPQGSTLFAGINRFPAATARRIDLLTGRATDERYWRLSFKPNHADETEASRAFAQLFDAEVGRQAVADVPTSIFLSGGTDSRTLLHGFAGAVSSITSFTMTFNEADAEAQQVADLERHYRFHSEIVPFDDTLSDVETVVRSVEEPFGDLIMSANHQLARAAGKRVKVVLSGEGGDEAFCGYDHQQAFERLEQLGTGVTGAATQLALRFLPSWITAQLNNYPGGFGAAEQARIRRVHGRLNRPAEAFIELIRLFDGDELDAILAPPFRRLSRETDSGQAIRAAVDGEAETWRGVMRAEVEQLTLPLNLLKQDRFCMSVSVEGRVPLAARPILEFAAGLPKALQMRRSVKPLLRSYSGGAQGRKRAFSLFASPRLQTALLRLFDDYVRRSAIEEMAFLHWPEIERLRSRAAAGGILATKQAMAVVVLMVWWRVFRPERVVWTKTSNAG